MGHIGCYIHRRGKHWLNLREKGQLSVWIMPASVIILLAVAYVPPPNHQCKM
jgi:hypothetical protein